MKDGNKIPVASKIPATKRLDIHRPPEAKAAVIPAWAPQPSPLTREEIRKQVIDQIG
ncbi:hypothetical protein [Microvirga aerophila]|uniref:Uncharacterized protein n=1 Tax=Microvirga aerophila TaxID=670291 RepID=A0A512BNX8_9HYPH|nr:hypothetical protein [Microvirga aerophila]GEO13662.1 hypothetical protein MAE02_13580 [Microvirga aerophila]